MIVAAAVRLPVMPDAYKPTMADLILFVPAPGRHHNVLHSLHYQFGAGAARSGTSYGGEVRGLFSEDLW
jgi:hypothetical protein